MLFDNRNVGGLGIATFSRKALKEAYSVKLGEVLFYVASGGLNCIIGTLKASIH